MKSPYVSDLEIEKQVTSTFQVYSKQVREKKTGEPFLSLVLSDRTGRVDAKMWDNVHEVKDTFECNDFVKVRGVLQLYNNRRQLTVQRLRRCLPDEIDPADYLPASSRSLDEMFAELRQVVDGIGNPHLKALLTLALDDDAIASRYRRAPAAKTIHHAYLGGLIEHVLSLCNLSRLVAQNYKHIDLDLLLAGAILHDIGKIYELGYELSFGYTSDGQLLGHIVLGVRLIEEKLRQLPDFPPCLRTLLEHMVLSHHGQLEFGSPKAPLFPEAMLLHFLDDMDSKIECMRALVESDVNGDRHWTAYSGALERMVLKKKEYLEDGGKPRPPAYAQDAGSAPPPQQPASAPVATRPPAIAPSRPEPRREPRGPGLLGEKLAQALQSVRKDD